MTTPPNTPPNNIRLGARGSLLSRLQSALVANALHAQFPTLQIETLLIKTSGDTIQDRPLHDFGGKGLFTKELEQALLRREIDFAVHSYKDVPVTMPLVNVSALTIVGSPPRETRDALVSLAAKSIADLPPNARVGTGSLRRQAQLLNLRPDLQVLPIRGNVDTRLRKLRQGTGGGEFDAILLALAGLKRANLFDPALMTPIPLAQMLPAAGQGALALQCRKDDADLIAKLTALTDPTTTLSVFFERIVVQRLQGDCHSPIAVYATITSPNLSTSDFHLTAAVARRDGRPPVITAGGSAPYAQAQVVVDQVVADLVAQGAMPMLHDAP